MGDRRRSELPGLGQVAHLAQVVSHLREQQALSETLDPQADLELHRGSGGHADPATEDVGERGVGHPAQGCDLPRRAETVEQLLQDHGDREKFVERPSWDRWAIGLAQAAALRSDCLRSKVGAVILDSNHRVGSVGYNGYPSGSPVCGSQPGGCPRGRLGVEVLPPGSPYTGEGVNHPCRAVHAETNAVLHCEPVRRHTLYVTREPCDGCWALLAGSGLARVCWLGSSGLLSSHLFMG
ncbi:deaminase [Kineococcus sp. NPDC059986]|uniref:deoxycytidylate deaminase n=1 Tax=Kineococcus sp. NPDC059986 TaxID=3155538 RepID=UPI00344D4A70